MTLLLFVLALSLQEDPLDALLRSLTSDKVQDREAAAAEIQRRGDAAVDILRIAEAKAATPGEKAKIREVFENILGYKPLTPDLLWSLRITLRVPRSKASELALELRKASGIPVVLDAPPNLDPELPALEAKEESLNSVLDRVSRLGGGHWLLTGRHVLLVLPGALPVKLFDVRDLTEVIFHERPVSLEPGGIPYRPLPNDSASPLSMDSLESLIRHDVSPKSWEESDDRSIQGNHGWLIVRNDPDVLVELDRELEKIRRKVLVEVRVEIEAYAVRAGAGVEEADLDRLRKEAAEGKNARRVASFERVTRDKRQIALSSVTRLTFLTGYSDDKSPVIEVFSAGMRANVRASLSDDRRSAHAEIEAGWTRLLSADKRKEAAGEVQVPVFASHSTQSTSVVPTGRFVILGRIGETKLVDGLPDLVLIGRFSPVPRR